MSVTLTRVKSAVYLDPQRMLRAEQRQDLEFQDLVLKIQDFDEILKVQTLVGKILKLLDVPGNILKLIDVVGKIWRILNLAGKILKI